MKTLNGSNLRGEALMILTTETDAMGQGNNFERFLAILSIPISSGKVCLITSILSVKTEKIDLLLANYQNDMAG